MAIRNDLGCDDPVAVQSRSRAQISKDPTIGGWMAGNDLQYWTTIQGDIRFVLNWQIKAD